MPMLNKPSVWMVLVWLASSTTAEEIQYGMRIRPPAPPTFSQARFPKLPSPKPSPPYKQTLKLDTPSPKGKLELEPRAQVSSGLSKSFYNLKPLTENQQRAAPVYSTELKDNPKGGATFFFTQVEPHRFEYRAMFQHEKNLQTHVYQNEKESHLFQPFVHDFDSFSKSFPPLPNFPSFPHFPEFFNEHKPNLPEIFNNEHKEIYNDEHKANLPELFNNEHKEDIPEFFNRFAFPTLPPAIKRTWAPAIELQDPPRSNIEESLGLGHHGLFPKIFKFNDERINIEDFDKEKKLRFFELAKRNQNELMEHENVKRENLLILHGGIFTVQEPPLFSKHIKKRRKPNGFNSRRLRLYKN